jgi:predicted nucleic acid-binding protein
MYLCDTCVLIEYLRGNIHIRDKLLHDKPTGLALSTVIMMELLIGAFNMDEVRSIKKTLFANSRLLYRGDSDYQEAAAFYLQHSRF